jgi:hypothetical protein
MGWFIGFSGNGQVVCCRKLLIAITIMSITVSDVSALGKQENRYFDNYF